MTLKDKIHIIEDDGALRESLFNILKRRGYNVSESGTVRQAQFKLKKLEPQLILLDLTLPDGSGFDILETISPKLYNRVIVISGTRSIDMAVQAMKLGVFDFLVKPIERDILLTTVKKALDLNRQLDGYEQLKNSIPDFSEFERIVFRSSQMHEVLRKARDASQSDQTIMIEGETGTGKELLAYAIHNASSRKDFPIIPVNCAAIPEHLAESELFGFEQGAFTGASSPYSGKFMLAEKGSIFLDEIGELSGTIQSKLLRVLESGEIFPLKSMKPRVVNVRTIVATNRKLSEMVDLGLFRRDLYYRIEQLKIKLPPLRERREDIMLLAKKFLHSANLTYSKKVNGFSRQAAQYFLDYNWPGNVRELKNTVNELVTFINAPQINPEHLPAKILNRTPSKKESLYFKTLKDVEKEHIRRVLTNNSFNIMKTAKILGITRPSLYKKINAFNLRKKDS